ncbi:hypothetical protein DFS34DRAFT_618648 [Phlyctochytrium arcticum]|nr:hypothetical protein DFS34DRAFT_618648 [Phlyctochytrium arcticum]
MVRLSKLSATSWMLFSTVWVALFAGLVCAQGLVPDAANPIGDYSSTFAADSRAWTGNVVTAADVATLNAVPVVDGVVRNDLAVPAAQTAATATTPAGALAWTFIGQADPTYNGYILSYTQTGAAAPVEFPATGIINLNTPVGSIANPNNPAADPKVARPVNSGWLVTGKPILYLIIAVLIATLILMAGLLSIARRNHTSIPPLPTSSDTLRSKSGSIRSRPSISHRPEIEEIVVERPPPVPQVSNRPAGARALPNIPHDAVAEPQASTPVTQTQMGPPV